MTDKRISLKRIAAGKDSATPEEKISPGDNCISKEVQDYLHNALDINIGLAAESIRAFIEKWYDRTPSPDETIKEHITYENVYASIYILTVADFNSKIIDAARLVAHGAVADPTLLSRYKGTMNGEDKD